jgi:predicted acyltransferase
MHTDDYAAAMHWFLLAFPAMLRLVTCSVSFGVSAASLEVSAQVSMLRARADISMLLLLLQVA